MVARRGAAMVREGAEKTEVRCSWWSTEMTAVAAMVGGREIRLGFHV